MGGRQQGSSPPCTRAGRGQSPAPGSSLGVQKDPKPGWDTWMLVLGQQVTARQEVQAREENLAYFAAYMRSRSGTVQGRLPPKWNNVMFISLRTNIVNIT